MQKIELVGEIEASINSKKYSPWFPDLTEPLVAFGWRNLRENTRLSRSDYGTVRVLTNNTNADLSIFSAKNKVFDKASFLIELLSQEIIDSYSDYHVDFYGKTDLEERAVLACLEEAVILIETVPEIYGSVFRLVRSVHLIKIDDDHYDVSFSEPNIPFSIFISVPKNRIKADRIRVAEAIVHEAMHLQLSLIETVVPLIESNERKFYSPWKEEYRNSTGIVHALYVFQVVSAFYIYLRKASGLSSEEKHFIADRQSEILKQVTQISPSLESLSLTRYGRLLIDACKC